MGLLNIARILKTGRAWRGGHGSLLLGQVYDREANQRAGYTDRDHVAAAAEWLKAAQDAMTDGGVCGRYRLHAGWSSSYPETTGYIIPTFLALAEELNDPDFVKRAETALAFLLRLQLDSGAFPGAEVAENTTEPSPFNTAQIINGLVAWHAQTGEARALDAAVRAGEWLVSIQDEDGAWRKHYYRGLVSTYSTHLSCWLAELGEHTGDDRFTASAARHLEWALKHRDPETGWFDLAGFDTHHHEARTAPTHTIAYTLFGVLRVSEAIGHQEGLAAVRQAAGGIMRRLELSKRLPGFLDHRWRDAHAPACLTGNAQMALIWFRLFELFGDARHLNAAFKALDLIKQAQPMTNPNPGIRGGVPGSDPIWGDYIPMAIPNWSAKFFCDALIRKRQILERIGARPKGKVAPPDGVPAALPGAVSASTAEPIRFVLYTSPRSRKVPQLLEAWSRFGFVPEAVVISEEPALSLRRRILRRLGQRGLKGAPLPAPASTAAPAGPSDSAATPETPADYCKRHGIQVVKVGSLTSKEAVRAVEALAPDIAVHAGAGILRKEILDVPRLGTLNAHMGLLPYHRGVNVTEWALFNGEEAGCSVHLIDPGIDTGRILCTRKVDVSGAASVADARKLVDDAQVALLGEVVAFAAKTGALPSGYNQTAGEGVQFFTMHEDLKAVLEADLSGIR